MLRQKFLNQAEREKFKLQHKLDSVSHSINALKRYEDHSPKKLRESYTMGISRVRDREWR